MNQNTDKEKRRERLFDILDDLDTLKKKGFRGVAKAQIIAWPPEARAETVEFIVELRKEMPLEELDLL
jgi:hypothetical protein